MRQKILAAAVVACVTCIFAMKAYSQEDAAVAASAPAKSSLRKEIERGYQLKDEKRNVEALTLFKDVLKKDPGNHAALTEIGYINEGLKHYNSAVKYLGAASAQDPGNMRLHMDLGYSYQALKQRESAQNQFKIVSQSIGEFQAQAQEALTMVAAATAAAGQPDAKQLRLREQGYAALNRGDKAAARTAFEAAVANNPKDETALKQLGFINLNDGNFSAAAANFEAIRALNPSDYLVSLQLGYTYDSLRKKDQAREAFGAALASTDAKIHDAAQAALQSSGGASAPAPASSL